MVFHAAVHFADAYLWEQRRRQPRHHQERQQWLSQAQEFRQADAQGGTSYAAYMQLRDITVQPAVVDQLLQDLLEHVRQAVYRALGQPLPP
jgi:hypothetical protein